jgi:hypothetical protein
LHNLKAELVGLLLLAHINRTVLLLTLAPPFTQDPQAGLSSLNFISSTPSCPAQTKARSSRTVYRAPRQLHWRIPKEAVLTDETDFRVDTRLRIAIRLPETLREGAAPPEASSGLATSATAMADLGMTLDRVEDTTMM